MPCRADLRRYTYSPVVIRATFAMFGAKRMILISDSMRATGLNDGDYTLGGQPVKVKRQSCYSA